MPRVLWLDDQLEAIMPDVEQLRLSGHDVSLASSEHEAIAHLEAGLDPQVFIQDLRRPKSPSTQFHQPAKAIEPDSGMDATAGWLFYERYLRRDHPHIPVIIFSLDAFQARNQQRADDFNLALLQKSARVSTLIEEVHRSISAQRPLFHKQAAAPAIAVADFETVNHALIKHLSKHPHSLYEVSWSSFEDLVARLLQELGYEVQRTKLTRDGGVDLWAIHRHDLGETLYAIDTKKFAPDHLVGPEPVRAIRGVASLESATVGMIVTTSRFGPAALAMGRQYRYLLSLKDFDAVHAWIDTVAGNL